MIPRLLLALLCVTANSHASTYEVSVWSNVHFDTQGRATSVAVNPNEEHPVEFKIAVESRLKNARIQPRIGHTGLPAEFRTGVLSTFEVTRTAQGGALRLISLDLGPLPLRQPFDTYYETNIQEPTWEGLVRLSCRVNHRGSCEDIEISAAYEIPTSARDYLERSLKIWKFEPQRIDGKAISSDFNQEIRIKTPGGDCNRSWLTPEERKRWCTP